MSHWSFRASQNVEDQEIDDEYVSVEEEALDTLLAVCLLIRDGGIEFNGMSAPQIQGLIGRIERAMSRLQDAI